MPPRQFPGSGKPSAGLPDAELVDAAFMALSDGADEADSKDVFHFLEAARWRPVDQAGFRVALAAYLSDPPDRSFDGIQPPLLHFKLIDSLRKAVRSTKLAKFFKRDLDLKAGDEICKSVPGASRGKEYDGPSTKKMASALHDLRKSRCHRTQQQHTPAEGRMEAKKQEYVQRLNGLTPPMRNAAAQRASAVAANAGLEADGSVHGVVARPPGPSSRALTAQHESFSTELQRMLPSALQKPGSACASSAHAGLWRHGSWSPTGDQVESNDATAGSPGMNTGHSKAWAALQDILTLPDTISGEISAAHLHIQAPPGLRSAASMFDELIDTPCGHGGGHGHLPLSLLHSRHRGSGATPGPVDAGVVLELGAARDSPRGGDAGRLSPAFGRSGKKTLRIRDPRAAAGASPGSPTGSTGSGAILKRASAAVKGAQCVSLMQSCQASAQSAAGLAAEQATMRLRKEYFATIPLDAFRTRSHEYTHHAFAATGRHTAPEQRRPHSRAPTPHAWPRASQPGAACASHTLRLQPTAFAATGSRPMCRAPAGADSAAAPAVQKGLDAGREGFPAALAAAREVPGTPPRGVAAGAELRQVPLERRYRLLQLRMAAQYRKQAWSVLGPLAQDGGGTMHVRGLQVARDEGKVARVVRGRHEAHFLTCVP